MTTLTLFDRASIYKYYLPVSYHQWPCIFVNSEQKPECSSRISQQNRSSSLFFLHTHCCRHNCFPILSIRNVFNCINPMAHNEDTLLSERIDWCYLITNKEQNQRITKISPNINSEKWGVNASRRGNNHMICAVLDWQLRLLILQ